MWKIFYDDGSTFCSDDGSPLDAPKFGVQVIVQSDPEHGRATLFYFDYFVYRSDDDVWVGIMGHDALVDQIAHRLPVIGAMVVGRYIPPARFAEIQRKAAMDEYLPLNNATRRGENPDGFK